MYRDNPGGFVCCTVFALAWLIAASSCRDQETISKQEGTTMTIQLTSAAFEEGASIPSQHTCDGADISPPLKWTGVPQQAKSLALICDDPDAPIAVSYTHLTLPTN